MIFGCLRDENDHVCHVLKSYALPSLRISTFRWHCSMKTRWIAFWLFWLRDRKNKQNIRYSLTQQMIQLHSISRLIESQFAKIWVDAFQVFLVEKVLPPRWLKFILFYIRSTDRSRRLYSSSFQKFLSANCPDYYNMNKVGSIIRKTFFWNLLKCIIYEFYFILR